MIYRWFFVLAIACQLPFSVSGDDALKTVFIDPVEGGAFVHRLVRGSRSPIENGFTLTGTHEEFIKAKRHGPAVFYEKQEFGDGELSFEYRPVTNSMLVLAIDTLDEGHRYHLAKVQFVERGLMITSFVRGEKGVPAKGQPRIVGPGVVPEKAAWTRVELRFSGTRLTAKINDRVFESTAPSFGETKHHLVLTTNIGDASFRRVVLKVPTEKKEVP